MAQPANDPTLTDPLLTLRRALSSPSSNPPILTTSADLSASENPATTTDDLSAASHLYVAHPIPQSIPLSAPTRFVSAAADRAIDLRSIYFAWLKRDVAIPEYIASAQEVNGALEGEGDAEGRKVLNLVFVERLDLITWLEGASEESEYIRPLEGVGIGGEGVGVGVGVGNEGEGVVVGGGGGGGAARDAEASAGVASGAMGGVPTVPSSGAGKGAVGAVGTQAGRAGKTVDARLQVIYSGERRLGDRNTVLRGIRPTDFSHVRKTADLILGPSRARAGYPSGSSSRPEMKSNPSPSAGPGSISKKPTDSSSSRRPSPIILVSPSASSLLRMSNIKTFLSEGVYIPPDHPSLSKSTGSNLLHITRTLQTISGSSRSRAPTTSSSASASGAGQSAPKHKPTLFILVDSTADFKPDYWDRVVAVFTTGQTWQFKSYKWSSPPELFKHATGIYVGWRGEDIPRDVKGWGRGVRSFAVDRWDEKTANNPGARWRDRGAVEGIWSAIEEGMRARGWGSSK